MNTGMQEWRYILAKTLAKSGTIKLTIKIKEMKTLDEVLQEATIEYNEKKEQIKLHFSISLRCKALSFKLSSGLFSDVKEFVCVNVSRFLLLTFC